jgi:tRNA (guanine-N7-)-methyltransferase
MRGRRTISPTAAAVEYVPANYFAPLDLRDLFPSEAPLEVDVGCGDGSYLAALAAENPDHNFLGIERLAGRIRSTSKKIAQRNLGNARVMLVEATYAVAYLLPPGSVTAFHVLFPDPWPKRRHQHRRVLDREFFRSLHRALLARGTIRIATDQADYFEQIRDVALPMFAHESENAANFASTFQRRFEECAVPIYRLVLRKTSDVR